MLRRVSACFDNSLAASRTWADASTVCSAPDVTPVMFCDTSDVPAAACSTLCAVSRVAADYSSTADAIAEEISLSSPIVLLMPLIALTAFSVALWIALI